ncbi:PIF1 [Mytilus coruscus]|uniref:PIF1 n=1 Tax=Mytilus coruscus TaxID=42192 RepID=A0A6J8CH13_MYTCO|nr:PIF1 [Mytilus coruscus]
MKPLAFLNSLNRPTENEKNAVQLFARNLDVDLFNYNKLQSMPGKLKVYKAQDQGSEHYLNRTLAPKNLGIKHDCNTMLVKNLSESLLNGLRGIVTKLYANSVDVEFMIDNKSVTANVTATDFTVFYPVDKIDLAKRTQLQLKLAYAMTKHKAQGMTLKKLVVNCENCSQPGQVGVAVGRAESIEGLCVLNFKKTLYDYEKNSLSLLTKYGLGANGPYYQCLTSILFYLENQLFKTLSGHLQLQSPEPLPKLTVDDGLCGAARGKIRYVSGYVIAKLKHKMDYQFLKKEKGKALRKKVMDKSKKKSVKAFKMQFFKDNKSDGKTASHLRLKSELVANSNFLTEKTFTKNDLLLLCKIYNVTVASSKRKNDISSVLSNAILNSDSIPYQSVQQTEQSQILDMLIPGPSILNDQIPGPSIATPHSPPKTSDTHTCITDSCSEASALPPKSLNQNNHKKEN